MFGLENDEFVTLLLTAVKFVMLAIASVCVCCGMLTYDYRISVLK
jgi:hypothetical protein